MKVVSNPDDIGRCGCGRSPTGKCMGWHALSEQAYQKKLSEWKLSHAQDSSQPADLPNRKTEPDT
jgi:hypothetical protein